MSLSSIFETMKEPAVITTMLLVSGGLLLACVIAIPAVLVHLPADYFKQRRPSLIQRLKENDWKKNLLLIGKNVLGLVLLAGGILMLALPGQGVLTILAALVLLDYPKKHQIEMKLIRMKQVNRAANWIRRQFGAPPLVTS